MTRKLFALPLLLLLALTAPCRADLIKQSAAYQRTVLMTSSSDHVTGATGLALTVTLSKAGAAYASIVPTVTELGAGVYTIALATGNTGTLGALDMHVTATGADPADTHDQIVAFDPNDASLLGLTGVATAATQATNVSTLSSNQAAILGRLGTPTGASIDADILTRLAASAYTAPLVGSTPPAWYTQTGDGYGLIVSLLNGGHTAFTAPALANAPTGGGGGGSVTVAGYATGQDPATLLASSFAAIPAAILGATVDGTLTVKQILALQQAVNSGKYAVGNLNTTAHTKTFTYYRADNTTVLATSVVTYDTSNANVVSRAVTFSNLP
jgi:hypothetical protein